MKISPRQYIHWFITDKTNGHINGDDDLHTSTTCLTRNADSTIDYTSRYNSDAGTLKAIYNSSSFCSRWYSRSILKEKYQCAPTHEHTRYSKYISLLASALAFTWNRHWYNWYTRDIQDTYRRRSRGLQSILMVCAIRIFVCDIWNFVTNGKTTIPNVLFNEMIKSRANHRFKQTILPLSIV